MITIRNANSGTHYEILLRHPNGEERWLPIEAWAERWITIRWEMAGQYDIMLKSGAIISRSASSRRKFNQVPNPWIANLDDCRQFIADKYGLTKEEIDAKFADHHASMPFAKPGIRNSAAVGSPAQTATKKRG